MFKRNGISERIKYFMISRLPVRLCTSYYTGTIRYYYCEKYYIKTYLLRTQITRDTDLLSPNGWRRALRRLILHGNNPFLQVLGSRNRKLWLADCYV